MALSTSAMDTCVRSSAKAHSSAVSHNVLMRRGTPPEYLQPMVDVLSLFTLVERSEMESQPHALHELLQTVRLQSFTEFGLASENDAQHLLLGRFDT